MHPVLAVNCACTTLQVTKGNDVVITIEKAKTDRNDKPFDDIKIMDIEVAHA